MTGQIGAPTADSIDDVGHAQFVFSERLDNGQTEGMRDGPKHVCLQFEELRTFLFHWSTIMHYVII